MQPALFLNFNPDVTASLHAVSPFTTSSLHTRTRQQSLPTMATGVDAKLLKSTKFPPEFSQKVDMQKVNLQVMKK